MSAKKYKPIEYVNEVLIPGIERIKKAEPYFCFSIIACNIEFLGSFFDSETSYKPGLPYDRFKKGIELFPDKYKGKSDKLYFGLRCGFAHMGKPSDIIALTTESELKENDTHLKNIGGANSLECWLLVLEEFTEDFKLACENLEKVIKNYKETDESKSNKTYVTNIETPNGLYSGGTFNSIVHKKTGGY